MRVSPRAGLSCHLFALCPLLRRSEQFAVDFADGWNRTRLGIGNAELLRRWSVVLVFSWTSAELQEPNAFLTIFSHLKKILDRNSRDGIGIHEKGFLGI